MGLLEFFHIYLALIRTENSALMFGGVSNLAEIPALYAQRPIVQKHMRAGMYHPFSEALALTLVDIPISFIAQLIFSVVLYFLVQLQQTPGQFL